MQVAVTAGHCTIPCGAMPCGHCEERSDEAIFKPLISMHEIAALRSQ